MVLIFFKIKHKQKVKVMGLKVGNSLNKFRLRKKIFSRFPKDKTC